MINKIDLAGIGFGFLISLTAWIRYFTHPADLGETILAGLIGLLFIIQFLIHHNQTKLAITQYDIETYLADMNREDDE